MTTTHAPKHITTVNIEVSNEHPHLLLQRSLDWFAIERSLANHWRDAGKNVDRGPGRPFDLAFWTRVIVLMLLLKLDSRQMERELKYNAVSRLFVTTDRPTEGLIRDHSNIDRNYRALGVSGIEELNRLVIRKAEAEGFTNQNFLSSDTTVQELRIGYPNEVGILRGVGMRVLRLAKRVVRFGLEGASDLSEKVLDCAKQLFQKVKHHRLFAKNQEEKKQVLGQIIEHTESLMNVACALQASCARAGTQVATKAGQKLQQLQCFISGLVPQVKSWMETGRVATEKLLHPGVPEARSHDKKKPGKKVEFGFKWLVNRLAGGYLFGQMYLGRPAESEMPAEALAGYREVFGEKETPDLMAYDRGGWSQKNVRQLKREGVQRVGIMPKGKAGWCVGALDQVLVKSLRGQTEASIGTVKTEGYGFNKPKQRSRETIEQSGQRAFASKNLNKLLSDLTSE